MTDTQRPWDRLPTETPKSYAAFRAYCEMGQNDPSVRPHVNTMSKLRHLGPKSRR